ncbi:MAG: transcription elongation factor GreA [Oscillospiraceae bacterium]
MKMAKEIKITQEGYDALVKELEYLKNEKRADISEKIKIARGFGDLSENSEYDEAKNEQAIVEARILVLEQQLKSAMIIDKSLLTNDKVSIGSKVVIRDVEFDDILEYKITSSVEAHGDMEAITDESPVGRALMGAKVGEVVDVVVPSGAVVQYQVEKISI